MSTLSMAPQTVRPAGRTRGRSAAPVARPRPGTSFDFSAPVTAIGHDDPALRVLEVASPRVATAEALHPVPAPRAVRTFRLTRRGRLVLTSVFLGLLLAAMVAAGGSWATASMGGGEPSPVRVVQVQSGDTLYDIAATVAEPGEVRQMVYRIQELNSLPTATIAEGQELAVPRG